jgi:phosphohistidine phosphatase
MKEIIFVRHAKSDWGNEFLKDIDRHLSERGYSDAYFLSDWFVKNKTSPARIVTSTATRALNTALIFSRAMDFKLENFALEKRIYEASSAKIAGVIKEQDNSVSSIMLFGHNPGFTDICNELSDDLFFDNVPTCGIVSFNFDIQNWSELVSKKGKLNYYQFPKNFKNQD